MRVGTKAKSIIRRYQELNIKEFELIDLNQVEADIDLLIGGRLYEEDFTKHPSLKYVYVPYTGLNALDLNLCQRRGIKVYNSHTHAKYIAERALALTLGLLGKIVVYHQNLMNGSFSNRNNENRLGWTSLFDKTVGIYGYGHIGREVKKLFSPFNCHFLAYDINKTNELDYVDSLEKLAEQSDIVVICAPLTPSTAQSFGKTQLNHMENKFLINVGRGKIVDEDDLYYALSNQTLRGFGSDVWFTYPKEEASMGYPSKYPIHEMENVVMTPHCAAFSEASKNEVFDQLFEDIKKLSNNQEITPVKIEDYL